MNPEKRTVSTDALATLGTIIENGGRDAIHLAVEPVIAGEKLDPGQRIGLSGGKAYAHGDGMKALGIVDPFLETAVLPNQKFWLIVFPRQITSLRHVWEHPDFPESEQFLFQKYTKEQSEKWLRNWCDMNNEISYEDLIAVMTDGEISETDEYGKSWSNQGDYLLCNGRDASGEIPLEVWLHLEAVIGKKLESYPSHFSCTC